jgi:hypothetical protein
MADADGHDTAEEIQVLIPIGVPNVLILGARNDERLFIIVENGRKEVVPIRENDLFFGHV